MPRSPVIGVVGTAKNTGKTTTLAALLGHCWQNARCVAVTGIGYDGEEVDTITLLPKPRLLLREQAIIATSEDCLAATHAGYRIRKHTGVRTPLGEVVIAEITRSGMVVIAGPNTVRSLRQVLDALKAFAPDLILVDGALNRIAPLSIADCVIFATGAARATDARLLAEEMHAIEAIFRLPRAARAVAERDATSPITVSALYDAADSEALLHRLAPRSRAAVAIAGFASTPALDALCAGSAAAGGALGTLVLHDPITCLLAGEPARFGETLCAAAAAGIEITLAGGPVCAAVTVNPFYPQLRDHAYVPAWIDKAALLDAVANAVRLPVFNIRDTDSSALFSACLAPPAA